MLSVSFSLTTAQTKMLLKIAYHDLGGDLCLPNWTRPNAQNDFVGVVRRLCDRGLVSHHEDCPAYRITDAGKAMADLIVKECRWACELADTADARYAKLKPIMDADNKRRAAYKRSIGAHK